LLFGATLGANLIPADTPQQITAETVHRLKMELVDQINHDRREENLQPVAFFEELSLLADEHCREMTESHYVSHWDRAGLSPYMRYSSKGITDFVAENIGSYWSTRFQLSTENLRKEIRARHESFMAERPPSDLHRQTVLNSAYTHVGIGLAFDDNGVSLIEVFAARYVMVEVLPLHARRSDKLRLVGKVLSSRYEVYSVSVFYDPTPTLLSANELNGRGSYQLPDDQVSILLRLSGSMIYADGSRGDIVIGPGGSFNCPILFRGQRSGVYTVAVWIRNKKSQEEPFMVTNISIFVD
jgi:uncharacterized protein YkwD